MLVTPRQGLQLGGEGLRDRLPWVLWLGTENGVSRVSELP